jgi:hypothetical protein
VGQSNASCRMREELVFLQKRLDILTVHNPVGNEFSIHKRLEQQRPVQAELVDKVPGRFTLVRNGSRWEAMTGRR